ncbi:MAG: thioredoxin-disulfide reductase [Hyphomicrobiales bacterium]|nr:thioredoxin-disulfide reductase [Hyphomicrobiales bacterium]MCY4032751.1 thioredoxin-disulfide reductase [Hyphomicrobiales bacterium]MCY4039590.1 thioredoxin-disulfide reductase [Hyphomicrobiales bacterium]
MSEGINKQVLILGAGPAGYAAAIYAARAMLDVSMLAGPQPGGQLTITTDVENYPGFAEPIQGPWLMEQMRSQVEHLGVDISEDIALEADLSTRPFRITGDSGAQYAAQTLVIATGAEARWLGVPGEERYRGYGVSACATCDGFFFRDKEVIVVGGGNTAVEEALFLTRFAKRVRLLHRRDTLRAEQILQNRLLENPKIEVIWNVVVEEILGNDSNPPQASGVNIRNTQSGETGALEADGIFIAIGHLPATGIFHGQLDMSNSGHIRVHPPGSTTSVEGVFAAGDVADDTYRQAITAAGMGCIAALDAERFLASEKPA